MGRIRTAPVQIILSNRVASLPPRISIMTCSDANMMTNFSFVVHPPRWLDVSGAGYGASVVLLGYWMLQQRALVPVTELHAGA